MCVICINFHETPSSPSVTTFLVLFAGITELPGYISVFMTPSVGSEWGTNSFPKPPKFAKQWIARLAEPRDILVSFIIVPESSLWYANEQKQSEKFHCATAAGLGFSWELPSKVLNALNSYSLLMWAEGTGRNLSHSESSSLRTSRKSLIIIICFIMCHSTVMENEYTYCNSSILQILSCTKSMPSILKIYYFPQGYNSLVIRRYTLIQKLL